MSIGSLGGIASSVAATALAQSRSADVERTQQDTSAQQRQVQSETKANAAAGIGETDGQEQSSADRDADGRRPWQWTLQPPSEAEEASDTKRVGDPSGESGTQLDLSG